ncbi:MAG: segregation/condensation protein A [Rhodobiaceae bacterium]|nr:segregation/condensation protein A [Rhodobiaceae bacterium]
MVSNVLEVENHLIIDIEGFEGPIDLLLSLARSQKVDLKEISVFELAQQYINYINSQTALKIDIAADYLVMAAWLAYLKSKLLLPDEPIDEEDEYTAEELAGQLRHRMQRLDAMKTASLLLFDRPIINRDVFLRGVPEEFDEITKLIYNASIFDLIKSYISRQDDRVPESISIFKLDYLSLDNAKNFLSNLFKRIPGWANFFRLVSKNKYTANDRSVAASAFSVLLDMVNEQKAYTKQEKQFGEILVKKIGKD